jgi:hypothetical protein
MSAIANLLDTYERRARFYPALVVVVPTVLGVASWLPAKGDWYGIVGGTVVATAIASLLNQLVRDQGKAKEAGLFRSWGGKPSVNALSYRHGVFDTITLARYHRALKVLDPGLSLPVSARDEAEHWDDSKQAYESANELLLSRTRDRSRFGLVCAENINYGYRRNLWAMKKAGLVSAAVGLVGSAARLVTDWVIARPATATAGTAVFISTVILVIWLLRISKDWVRLAADAYARQLVSTCDQLQGD